MKHEVPRKPTGSRIQELDVFRGLAAVYVVLTHCLTMHHSDVPDGRSGTVSIDLPVSGQFAVHLFFIISGFVIFMTLGRCRTAGTFLVRRCVRIYPTYWVAVLFTGSILWLFSRPPHAPLDAGTVLLNLTLVHQFFGVKNVDGVYWTLAVEAAFYFWMALLLLIGQIHRVRSFGWAWLVLCVVAMQLQRWPQGALFLEGGTTFPLPLDHFLLLRHAPLFLAGICFHQLWSGTAKWRTHLLIAASFATYLYVCVRPGHTLGISTVATGASIFIAFYAFIYGWLRWIAFRPLVFLGTISYALYVAHDAWGTVVRWYLIDRWGVPDPVALVAVFFGSLGIATLITFGVERPAQRWWRNRERSKVRIAPGL